MPAAKRVAQRLFQQKQVVAAAAKKHEAKHKGKIPVQRTSPAQSPCTRISQKDLQRRAEMNLQNGF